jgi:hypothetical protein
MKTVQTLLICVLIFTLPLRASKNKDADAEASRGLLVLKQLITAENYKDYGFNSMEEVSQLELGTGIDVFYVFNDDLKGFQATTDPGKVIKPSETRIYPVTVKGEGRLLITVRLRDGKWRTAKFGRPDLALNLAKRQANQKAFKLGGSNEYELEIPAMHLNFVAVGRPDVTKSIMLLPLDHFTMVAVSPELKNVPPTAAVSGIKTAQEVFGTLSEKAMTITAPEQPSEQK